MVRTNLVNTVRNKFHSSNIKFWESATLLVLFIFFIIQAQYNFFGDEYDNMLGGKLINEGILLYRDYFSHHMPLPYYLAALINLISGPSPLNIRYIFLIILYAWLLFFHKNLRELTSPKISLLFIALVVLINPVIWSHMLLAETLIAYSAIHISILFLKIMKDKRRKVIGTDMLQVAFIGSIPLLSSLGFWALSIFYYSFFLWLFSRDYLNSKVKDYRGLLRFAIIYCMLILIPYSLFVLHFILGQSLNDFYLYNIIFNQEYYSIYNVDIPRNNTQMFTDLFANIFNSLSINLQQLSDFPETTYRLILKFFVFGYIGLIFLMRRKTIGIFFLFSYFFLNARQGDIFIENNFHEIQVMLFAILCITLTLHIYFENISREEVHTGIKRYVLTINFSLLIILVGYLFDFNKDILELYRNDKMPSIIHQETKLNNIVNSGDVESVWIGPAKFEEFFFLEPEVASKYYYWYPWHNSCPTCKSELLQDLQKNKPEIVYWNNNKVIWEEHNSNDYGRSIFNFLEENYTREDNLIYKLKE